MAAACAGLRMTPALCADQCIACGTHAESQERPSASSNARLLLGGLNGIRTHATQCIRTAPPPTYGAAVLRAASIPHAES